MHPTQLFQTLGVPPLPSSDPYSAPSYPSLQQLANPFSHPTPYTAPVIAHPSYYTPSGDARAKPKLAKKAGKSHEDSRLGTLCPSALCYFLLYVSYSRYAEGVIEFYDSRSPYFEYVLTALMYRTISHLLPYRFSNRSPHPIVIRRLCYPTAEHCAYTRIQTAPTYFTKCR